MIIQAFERIKKAVSTAPVLNFFSPESPTERDVSEKGIGFALIQKGQPVSPDQVRAELLASRAGDTCPSLWNGAQSPVCLWKEGNPLDRPQAIVGDCP